MAASAASTGPMGARVRNPMAGTLVTLAESLGVGFALCIPTIFIPIFELRLLYLGFAVLGTGFLAGRASIAGFLGFAGAFIGTFLAIYIWLSIAGWLGAPLPLWGLDIFFALGFGALGGLGASATGALGVRRVERMIASAPKTRTCERCGSRVGIAARKCWSCRATLRM